MDFLKTLREIGKEAKEKEKETTFTRHHPVINAKPEPVQIVLSASNEEHRTTIYAVVTSYKPIYILYIIFIILSFTTLLSVLILVSILISSIHLPSLLF